MDAVPAIGARRRATIRSAAPTPWTGLVRLADHDILHAEEYRQLSSGYVVLRTIEHALQRLHNRQSHLIPGDRRELEYLARRLDFTGADDFIEFHQQHRRAIQSIFERRILQSHATDAPRNEASQEAAAAHLGSAAQTYSGPVLFQKHVGPTPDAAAEARLATSGPHGASSARRRRSRTDRRRLRSARTLVADVRPAARLRMEHRFRSRADGFRSRRCAGTPPRA